MILWAWLLTSSLFAQSIPGTEEMTCPGEGFVVDYTSPVTNKRVQKCMIKVNGEIVEQDSAPAPVTAATPKKQDPKYAKAIQQLLGILSRQNSNLNGTFVVSSCDKNPMAWIRMALTKSQQTFSYSFKDGCDVEGSFTGKFAAPFPMNMKLRNLNGFNQTNMEVTLDLKKGTRGLLYSFKAIKGLVQSDADKVDFEAWYEIEVNPMTGAGIQETQKGEITIVSVNGEAMNLKEKLYY